MENNINIRKNCIYNMLSQIVNLIIPLITTPYISRALGVSNIGAISYTQAIISYLIIFAILGTSMFGIRQIAYYKGDKQKQEEFFSNIICLKAVIAIPAIIIYIYCVSSYKRYSCLLLAQGVYLIAEIGNVDWIYSGSENFKEIVLKNIAIKVLGTISIFILVKDNDDSVIYILILGVSLLLGNILMMIPLKRNIRFKKPSIIVMRKYFIGSLLLLLPQIAGTLYVYFDKIMIGILTTGNMENGYYEQAEKIIKLSSTVITALPTVMLPHISVAYSKNQNYAISHYMEKSMKIVIYLGIPMSIGIVGISDNLVPWFLGKEYAQVSFLLKIMAPIILFNGIYNVIGLQYMLAIKKERLFTLIIFTGAMFNIGLNYILIPRCGSIGASIASTLAEIAIAMVLMNIFKGVVRLSACISCLKHAAISGAIMLVAITIFSLRMKTTLLSTIILIIMGFLVYVLLQYFFKDEIEISILRILKEKIVS